MRVLHVVEAVEGGVGLHLRHLVGAQLAAGDEVGLAMPSTRSWGSTDRHVADDLEAAGATIFVVPMRRNPVHPANLRASVELRRILRRWRPDVVHTHATIGGALGRVTARVSGVPAVHTQHGVRFADPDGGLSARAGRWLERALRRATAVAIAVSASEAEVLRTVHRAERVVVVPNGLPIGAPPAARTGPDRIVSVGRFTYPKDPLTAVRVMAEVRRRHPGTDAWLVGYGDGAREVEALIESIDPGIEVRRDVAGPAAIADAAALLLCTHREGGPYVVLEAMERGVPVVANDVVGCRDVVDESVGGLFPVGDVAAGVAQLERILDDPVSARRLGEEARRRVERDHSVDAMARGTARAYDLARR